MRGADTLASVDARLLFDAMRRRSEAAMRKRAAPAGGTDRLSELPDDLLLYTLSFLSSRDAVRTCLLARRWRHQWKDVPALRITLADAQNFRSAFALNRFVNHLLYLRNKSPLHVAEINCFEKGDFEEANGYLVLWIRYSLSRQVGKLSITANDDEEGHWRLPERLITSEHLTTLELTGVESYQDLDFSSCVALVELNMEYSRILCSRVVSPSLKRLSITMCKFEDHVRTQICTPNLISFRIADSLGRTPLLGSMPLLMEAFVRLNICEDFCKNSYESGECGDQTCDGCHGSNYAKDTSVVLQGLSSSRNLELTAELGVFVFSKDLARCPVFSKLKTLLLNKWCMTANLGALICFLQHSPVLEKLVLQCPEFHWNLVEMGASYDLRMQPSALKDLTVEVKCYEVDEQILKILDVLVSYGLSPEKFEIQKPPVAIGRLSEDDSPSNRFSFEQKTHD